MKRNGMILVVVLLILIAVAANYPDAVGNVAVQSVTVEATASGDNQILSAVDGKKFCVVAYSVKATSTTAVSWYFKNDTNADIWGSASNTFTSDKDGIDGPAGEFSPVNPAGWFSTGTASEALEIHLSSATPVFVSVSYVLID